ncbi:Uncharacterized protein QTN25_002277 [Entamoeba marina]
MLLFALLIASVLAQSSDASASSSNDLPLLYDHTVYTKEFEGYVANYFEVDLDKQQELWAIPGYSISPDKIKVTSTFVSGYEGTKSLATCIGSYDDLPTTIADGAFDPTDYEEGTNRSIVCEYSGSSQEGTIDTYFSVDKFVDGKIYVASYMECEDERFCLSEDFDIALYYITSSNNEILSFDGHSGSSSQDYIVILPTEDRRYSTDITMPAATGTSYAYKYIYYSPIEGDTYIYYNIETDDDYPSVEYTYDTSNSCADDVACFSTNSATSGYFSRVDVKPGEILQVAFLSSTDSTFRVLISNDNGCVSTLILSALAFLLFFI